MNTTPSFENAASYLNLKIIRPHHENAPSQPRPFITISREAGAGATTLAQSLLPALNKALRPRDQPWEIYDGNLVEAMLCQRHYPSHLSRYLPEDSTSEIDASIGEILGLHPNLWELIQKTNEVIHQIAAQGHCILIDRGANYATNDLPQGFHLRLIASPEDRAQRMMSKLELSYKEALHRNVRVDACRSRYVRDSFDASVNDPTAYDLIANTSRTPLDQLSTMLVSLVACRTAVGAG